MNRLLFLILLSVSIVSLRYQFPNLFRRKGFLLAFSSLCIARFTSVTRYGLFVFLCRFLSSLRK